MGAFQVELVGESLWLALLLTLGPAALIAGAAIIAARVARQSALERQKDQLRHETERQKEQLERETERQREQLERETERQREVLEHDRQMRERESTRTVVDTAIGVAHDTIPEFLAFERAIRSLQEAMSDDGEVDDDQLDTAALEGQIACRDALTNLQLHSILLAARPGTDQLTQAYTEVVDTYREHLDALVAGAHTKLSERQMAAIKDIDDDGSGKLAAMLISYRLWLEGQS
jgi:phosphomannomutase